jgi:hypothetical protein
VRRTTPVLVVTAVVLALSGCQVEEANDNTITPSVPSPPPGVVRTPEPVESAPLVVDPPGATRSPG